MAKYDDLDVKRIFNVGIISVVVTAVTALAVQVVYYYMLDATMQQKTAQSNYRRQNAVLTDQTDSISNYGVDADTGNITIPIDKAMDLIVKENTKEDSNESDEENADET